MVIQLFNKIKADLVKRMQVRSKPIPIILNHIDKVAFRIKTLPLTGILSAFGEGPLTK